MIATSFVRLFPPTLHIIASDGPWYIFWEAFETSIANLMVSITSFKSIYGGINGPSSSKKTSSNLLSGVKPSLSSRMSRFFLRTSESSSSTTQNFKALLPTSTTKGIQDSQDFEWKTSRYYSPDEEKSFHTNVSPHITIREQIDIEVSRQSRLDRSPVSSNTFSPPSIQLDQQSKSLWNMIGKYWRMCIGEHDLYITMEPPLSRITSLWKGPLNFSSDEKQTIFLLVGRKEKWNPLPSKDQVIYDIVADMKPAWKQYWNFRAGIWSYEQQSGSNRLRKHFTCAIHLADSVCLYMGFYWRSEEFDELHQLLLQQSKTIPNFPVSLTCV